MNGVILPNADVSYLDDLLYCREGGTILPVSARELAKVKAEHLMLWCLKNAVYVIPTFELLDWLHNQIGGRPAMEIGPGKSCLGRHLGVRMVDNKMQQWPHIRDFYVANRQPPITYPHDVEEIDANEAVKKYMPKVVFGGYITQRGTPDVPQSSPHGPDEEAIVTMTKPHKIKYIHIGNLGSHGQKKILKRPNRVFHPKWLFTRAHDPSLNRIWVWNG